MQSYFMETICKTGIFIMCAQVLIHFRPKASYDKYLKMLVSAMILIQLFMPVSELFAGEGEQTLAERVEWFEAALDKCMEEASSGYEEELAALEAETGSGANQEPVFDEEALVGTSVKEAQSTVTSIAPISQIHISVGEGDEINADISTGDHG